MFLEREAERDALTVLLDGVVAGRGGAAVVGGPPGAGKTRLLDEAEALAGARGIAVLGGRGSALEQDFAFGVARQMLEGLMIGLGPGDRRGLLVGPALRAAAVLDLPEADAAGGDLHATVHGLHWLLANLADRAPLMLRVDDAQWVDEPSLRLLAYVARRAGDLRIGVVVARRDGAPSPAMVALEAAASRLTPAPLSPAGVAAVLAGEGGDAPAAGLVRVCRERTGGNPFLVHELASALSAAGVSPGDARAAATLAAALPEGVGESVALRLAGLGGAATALARAVAVLGDGADLLAAAEIAGLTPAEATASASALASAGLLDDDHPLRFRHPLLAEAVGAGTPAVERGEAHARAARLLAGRGAPAGRVAGHLVASPPGAGDPWVVRTLRDAARAARDDGAPEEAAVLLARARAEPPDPALRGDVAAEWGAAEFAALRPSAVGPLREALAAAPDAPTRADRALRLAIALYYGGDHPGAVDVLEEAISGLGAAPHREERLRLEAFLGVAGRYDLATERRTRGRVAAVAAGVSGATPGERLVRSVAALEASGTTAADLAAAAAMGEEADGERPWPDPGEGAQTVAMYIFAGRPDLAGTAAARVRARARETGSPLRHAVALACEGLVALDVGALRDAVADLGAATETMSEFGAGTVAPTAAYLVLALTESGGHDEAEAVLSREGLDGDLPPLMLLNPVLYARGLLHASRRRWEPAVSDLTELGGRHDRWGMTRPVPAWRSAAALALAASGAGTAARDLAAEELRIAREWGVPRSIAVAERALALVGGDDDGLPLLQDALARLEGTPWRLERARVRGDLGAALRRAGRRREAREQLMLAMDEAHSCGAEPVAARAAEESRAAGARPRRHALHGVESLTPSELRVATLVAAGRTNREVAHELFVTLATVETHLTRVYRKLGVPGRPGLRDALDATRTSGSGRSGA